jgi:hypothetical protein
MISPTWSVKYLDILVKIWYNREIMPAGVATGEKIIPSRQDAFHALILAGYSRDESCKILRMGGDVANVLKRKQPPHPDRVVAIKKGLAAKHVDVSDRALDATTDDKLQAMDALQLAKISGIHDDKALLLEGRATVIINYNDLSNDMKVIEAEIVEQEKKIKQLES